MQDLHIPEKTSAYITQHDLHIPEMTVREILDFSARFQRVGSRAGNCCPLKDHISFLLLLLFIYFFFDLNSP
jgi:hypothetical protein